MRNFITEYSNKFNKKKQKMLNANINFEKSNLKNNFQFIIKFEKQLKFRKKNKIIKKINKLLHTKQNFIKKFYKI